MIASICDYHLNGDNSLWWRGGVLSPFIPVVNLYYCNIVIFIHDFKKCHIKQHLLCTSDQHSKIIVSSSLRNPMLIFWDYLMSIIIICFNWWAAHMISSCNCRNIHVISYSQLFFSGLQKKKFCFWGLPSAPYYATGIFWSLISICTIYTCIYIDCI